MITVAMVEDAVARRDWYTALRLWFVCFRGLSFRSFWDRYSTWRLEDLRAARRGATDIRRLARVAENKTVWIAGRVSKTDYYQVPEVRP